MLVFRSLRRFLPGSPDWVIGGLIAVVILWLTVLPIEVLLAIRGQDFMRPDGSVWATRALYIFGFSSSLALVSPWTTDDVSVSDLRLLVVSLGLLIVSPVYFAVGGFLSIGKTAAKAFGILLLMVMLIGGGIATLGLLFYAD
jgi:hypothetical protein